MYVGLILTGSKGPYRGLLDIGPKEVTLIASSTGKFAHNSDLPNFSTTDEKINKAPTLQGKVS